MKAHGVTACVHLRRIECLGTGAYKNLSVVVERGKKLTAFCYCFLNAERYTFYAAAVLQTFDGNAVLVVNRDVLHCKSIGLRPYIDVVNIEAVIDNGVCRACISFNIKFNAARSGRCQPVFVFGIEISGCVRGLTVDVEEEGVIGVIHANGKIAPCTVGNIIFFIAD